MSKKKKKNSGLIDKKALKKIIKKDKKRRKEKKEEEYDEVEVDLTQFNELRRDLIREANAVKKSWFTYKSVNPMDPMQDMANHLNEVTKLSLTLASILIGTDLTTDVADIVITDECEDE